MELERFIWRQKLRYCHKLFRTAQLQQHWFIGLKPRLEDHDAIFLSPFFCDVTYVLQSSPTVLQWHSLEQVRCIFIGYMFVFLKCPQRLYSTIKGIPVKLLEL